MRILPKEKIIIQSPYNPEEVLKRLNNAITDSPAQNRHTVQNFTGKSKGCNFELSRIVTTGRNSFSPVIKGNVKNDGTGSRILIRIGLHRFVAAFMSVWLSVSSIIFILVIVNNPSAAWMPGMFSLFGYGLMTFGFNTHLEDTRMQLLGIVGGDIISEI